MSSRTEFIKSKHGSKYDRLKSQEVKDLKAQIGIKLNEKSKPHVTAEDLSPGGQPFHFAGPTKEDTNAKWKKHLAGKTARKIARKKLAA